MDVTERHPDLTADRIADWQLMRDTMDGSRAVKRRAQTYLPMPSGFASMDDGGLAVYNNIYKLRAIVPEILAPSVGAMIGIIHGKETQIEIPDGMAWIWENADGDGMPLEAFHRGITRNLLWLGRYGVLASAPATGGNPYLVGYSGDSLINWDRDFYVLDESGYQRNGFRWESVTRHRVLTIEDGAFVSTVYEGETMAASEPVAQGGVRLDFVPFTVGNARDVTAAVETPPLVGVSNAVINAYQLSADWRWQLYMSGQETLVAINGDAPTSVGAGVVHQMNGGDGNTPDLKYVSPSCSGIAAHDNAIQKQIDAAVMAGARMFEQSGNGQESGEARRLRFASETANLLSVAQVSAALLEKALRFAARISGMDEKAADEIVVTPPRDLLDNTMSAAEFATLFDAYERGGMAWETLYARGQAGGIYTDERNAEEEYALLEGDAI